MVFMKVIQTINKNKKLTWHEYQANSDDCVWNAEILSNSEQTQTGEPTDKSETAMHVLRPFVRAIEFSNQWNTAGRGIREQI